MSSIGPRCEVCGSKTEANDALCAACERAAELTVTNTESAAVSALPFVLLLSAGFILVFKFFPFLNSMPEFEWDDLIPPHWLNPWLFVVGVVVAAWGVSVLVIMQNDQSRWTGHPRTRAKIRNQSWFQIVAGVVLVAIAVAT